MNRLLAILFVFGSLTAFSQTAAVSGKLIYPTGARSVPNAKISFIKGDSSVTTLTGANGSFSINLTYGAYTISVFVNDISYSPDGIIVNTPTLVLGDVKLENAIPDDKSNQEALPVVTVSDNDLEDASSRNVSSVLGASRDIFLSTASFTMSSARFDIRGYRDENFATYLNGIPVNSLETGIAAWGQWGGLNNVFYNRDSKIGLQHTDFAFGGIGGAYSLDARAATQRKQLEVSYAVANRNYRHRLMATYSTGLLKHGWAVSVSASRRWAQEGYQPGTTYDGYSYFLSVQKYFGSKQSLNLTVLGAPTRSGGAFFATKEMFNLAGTNYYNPNWGYQNGEKRNASVTKTHQPLMVLTHEWKPDVKSSMVTAAGFSFGKRGRTGFDWYNAPNPIPDYYAYLPSYIEDSIMRELVENQFRNDERIRQINWDQLYEVNRNSLETVENADGIEGNNISGKRARYTLQNMVQDTRKFDFNTVYNRQLGQHFDLSTGITYQFQRNEFYKEVEDLLGADFYVDLNQFAERDFPNNPDAAQNDLNRPNRILYEGDKFGYDYFVHIHHAAAWAQTVARYKPFDFFVAGQLATTSYWRNGVTRSGLFPTESFGKSDTKTYLHGGVKGGITYKLNGRNYFFANGMFQVRPPYFDDAMLSPRTRNTFVNNLKQENLYSVEAGYVLHLPYLNLKLNGYYTRFGNETNTTRFYSGFTNTYTNYTMTNVNTRHMGIELGADAKIYKGFGASAVLAMGRYVYTDRPLATTTLDNSGIVAQQDETVYLKNFNVGGTPQLATSFGLRYNSPQFWRMEVNFNYYDWMWLKVSPARRTADAIDLVEPNSEQWNSIIDQERLKGQFTMDFRASYSWMLNNDIKGLKKKYYLVFSLNVTNLTNNTNFITGGSEATRFDARFNNAGKFPSRYYYAYGTTFFLNIAFRMN